MEVKGLNPKSLARPHPICATALSDPFSLAPACDEPPPARSTNLPATTPTCDEPSPARSSPASRRPACEEPPLPRPVHRCLGPPPPWDPPTTPGRGPSDAAQPSSPRGLGLGSPCLGPPPPRPARRNQRPPSPWDPPTLPGLHYPVTEPPMPPGLHHPGCLRTRCLPMPPKLSGAPLPRAATSFLTAAHRFLAFW
jgi:hypothetical protein